MMAEYPPCHHLNFPFNRGKKKIAKPINNIPRKAIRTETTIRIVNANIVFLENTSFLKSPHVVNSSFFFCPFEAIPKSNNQPCYYSQYNPRDQTTCKDGFHRQLFMNAFIAFMHSFFVTTYPNAGNKEYCSADC